jgi:hypothetical protein
MGSKWIEMLKEIASNVTRVAVVLNPENASNVANFRAIEAAAPSFKVELSRADVQNTADIERFIDGTPLPPPGSPAPLYPLGSPCHDKLLPFKHNPVVVPALIGHTHLSVFSRRKNQSREVGFKKRGNWRRFWSHVNMAVCTARLQMEGRMLAQCSKLVIKPPYPSSRFFWRRGLLRAVPFYCVVARFSSVDRD